MATLTIGGDTYALATYIEAWWQYQIVENDALDSENPIQSTGNFRGHVTIRRIYSTDKDLLSIQAPSGGMVPETTITVALKDTQTTPVTKTWTLKARLNRIRHMTNIGAVVIAEIDGPLTQVPTVA
ncbi:MAG: hypothetical protein ACE5OO_01135 [Candidatus Bathyarchaeia archaeon]